MKKKTIAIRCWGTFATNKNLWPSKFVAHTRACFCFLQLLVFPIGINNAISLLTWSFSNIPTTGADANWFCSWNITRAFGTTANSDQFSSARRHPDIAWSDTRRTCARPYNLSLESLQCFISHPFRASEPPFGRLVISQCSMHIVIKQKFGITNSSF